MQQHDSGAVRAVAWSEIWPWLALVRCFRLAVGLRLLLLSGVAMVLTLAGWNLFAVPFGFQSDPQTAREVEPLRTCPWLVMTQSDLVPNRPPLLDLAAGLAGDDSGAAWHGLFWKSLADLSRPLRDLSRPVRRLFSAEATSERLAYWLLCGLWTLGVWALFGGAICRVVAVRFAAEEHLGWSAMFGHAAAKWRAHVAAPLLPLLVILAIAVLMALVAKALFAWDWSVLVAGIFWPLALLGGLLMALLALGVVFGWPLMWATIGAEGTDSFDALSRSYAYVFQRPLHYLFYAAVAGGLGVLGWVFVSNFAAAVIALTYGAVAWGCGAERIATIANATAPLENLGQAGAVLVRFWVDCVKVLAIGFLYSYFWTAATVVYFLLRRDVDATEMDEVYLDQQAEPPHGLPPISTDQAGAPSVEQEGAGSEEP